jgi:hypothetical protein
VSAVTVTFATPPAGTVTFAGLTLNMPAGAFPATDSDNVTAALPVLRYVTRLLLGLSSRCGHLARPKLTPAGSGSTVCRIALARSTRPAPCWNTPSLAFGNAEAISAARSCGARQVGCCCARIAAAPATCGAAIDVPECCT